jgi:hypothetical protein
LFKAAAVLFCLSSHILLTANIIFPSLEGFYGFELGDKMEMDVADCLARVFAIL